MKTEKDFRDKDYWDEMDTHITALFNKFAGKIVDPANPQDPVLAAMRLQASRYYSYLRLVPSETQRDDDAAKITRINAELVDAGGGKWRIGNRFFRG